MLLSTPPRTAARRPPPRPRPGTGKMQAEEAPAMTGPTDDDYAELAALISRLARAGFALPGTLLERRTSCRKPGCRCTADPPALHGPYYQWTRKRDGKTVTINLTPDQATRYQPWFHQRPRPPRHPRRHRETHPPHRRPHRKLAKKSAISARQPAERKTCHPLR